MTIRSTASFLALAPLLAAAARTQTALGVQRVDGFYSRPLDVQAPRGDESRIFVVSQQGTIHVVKNGKLLPTPFLDLSRLITRAGNEQGLLGLVFHPDYRRNGYFYVNYSRFDGATMVVRYKVSSNPDVADPKSATTVLGPVAQPFRNHNAGQLAFGPDGMLYVGFGDGGSGGDPGCRAQNGQTFLGKMLRLDVNRTGPGYSVPKDNPFLKDPKVRNEIWHLGLRNPWRYSFDRATGDLYIGDVGQSAREEIDFQPRGRGGLNFGWKFMEGNNCFGSFNCAVVIRCGDPRLTRPIHDYDHFTGRSVTGGYVYRGCAIPDLRGTYFFGDYRMRRIWSFRFDGKTLRGFRNRTAELGIAPSVSSFGEDSRGELYICDLAGSVYKIVPKAPPPVKDLGFGKVGGKGQIPKFDACGLLTSGSSAEFSLTRAPGTAIAILAVSSQRNPFKLFGGTLVPLPVQALVTFVTDATGNVRFTVPGGGGPTTLFAQYVLLDKNATFGFGFSNALQIDFQR